MATFPKIYNANSKNKVIIQNGFTNPRGFFRLTECEVTKITQSDAKTFIIEHKPKTERWSGGDDNFLADPETLYLYLKIEADSSDFSGHYNDSEGKQIVNTSFSKQREKYGKFRSKPFYFKKDGNVFPSGDDGVSFDVFLYDFLIKKLIKVEGDVSLNFSDFFTASQGGTGRKKRKNRQSRKKSLRKNKRFKNRKSRLNKSRKSKKK